MFWAFVLLRWLPQCSVFTRWIDLHKNPNLNPMRVAPHNECLIFIITGIGLDTVINRGENVFSLGYCTIPWSRIVALFNDTKKRYWSTLFFYWMASRKGIVNINTDCNWNFTSPSKWNPIHCMIECNFTIMSQGGLSSERNATIIYLITKMLLLIARVNIINIIFVRKFPTIK